MSAGLSRGVVAASILVPCLLVWLATRWWYDRGGALPVGSWLPVLVVLGLAAVLLLLTRPPRRGARSRRRTEPVRALALAQAGALTGAILMGGALGYGATLWPDADAVSVADRLRPALATAGAAAALLIVGLIGERWCRTDIAHRRRGGYRERR